MNLISKKLLAWYKQQTHKFPWRSQTDIYKIWISEIMLQQTQVKTATPYYNIWTNKYKNVHDVANAKIDEILKIWEGFGYYQRAHNIHDTAKIIINNYKGVFPSTYADLIKLKGIGDYTASAILSIACHQMYPAIDANLKRVIARLMGITNFKQITSESKKHVLELMENYNPGEINQAFMDLGREICKIKSPKCQVCPLQHFCVAKKENLISYYTFKKNQKKKPTYNVVVGLIWKKNKILISKRKKKGLLGGLWELPGGKKHRSENNITCLEREINEELDIKVNVKHKIGIINHQYSHFGVKMTAYNCNYQSGKLRPLVSDQVKWVTPKQIKNFPFPKATHKLFSLTELCNV